jgi:ATP-dependent DNA helicase RecG
MAIEVQEIPNERKPCYYKRQGLRGNGGAYLRSGGTDCSMTDYEIFGYVSSRGQPKHDEDIITDATLDDLDMELVEDYVAHLRTAWPRAGYLEQPREDVLTRLHICGRDGVVVRPTLTGLLMFGKFPQEFLPQLMITFVQYYGTIEGERTPRGERFLDNQHFEGPIPEMINRAESHILGAMRKSSLIDGVFRHDVLEYPQEALREAIANAVAHRDYSSYVRGSYVQVRMFADRLEIQSPGGLFGNVTVENIEEEHSTRNARLIRMMEDIHIVENRGSGIKAMLHAMRTANLEPPAFDDRRTSFRVTFRNHTLMNPDAIAWLNHFAATPLNDRQRLVLVYLRQHQRITNGAYRRLTQVDPMRAGQELRGLVDADLVDQEGVDRWTSYRLKVSPALPEQREPQTDEDRIVAHVREVGSITNTECRTLLHVDDTRAYYLLKKLCDAGYLKPEGKGKWRKYVLASPHNTGLSRIYPE